jgi:hypothetical protein
VLVSLGLDQHIENLALSVDGPPQVDHSAVDFQIDLVEMPRRVRLLATLSQVGRDHGSEMVHPTPNRLAGHRQSALGQQILDVAKTEREPEIMGWTVPAPQWKNTGRNREWCDDDYNDRT